MTTPAGESSALLLSCARVRALHLATCERDNAPLFHCMRNRGVLSRLQALRWRHVPLEAYVLARALALIHAINDRERNVIAPGVVVAM